MEVNPRVFIFQHLLHSVLTERAKRTILSAGRGDGQTIAAREVGVGERVEQDEGASDAASEAADEALSGSLDEVTETPTSAPSRTPSVTPSIDQFVESMGRYFERYGLARIGGRIIGLLMVADHPLSLDEIATRLQVSRASVSTNIRLATANDLAELVTFPGDRRDYYRMIDDAWGHGMHAEIAAIPALRRIAERGLAALGPGETAAREQLEEMIDFCDFAMEERRGVLERWQSRREARLRERAQQSHRDTPGKIREAGSA